MIDLVGHRTGMLVVIRRVPSPPTEGQKRPRWLARCDCGNEKEILGESLRTNRVKSCGCKSFEMGSKLRITHGESVGRKVSDEYRTWQSMTGRCTNINNPKYPIYGGRGITVCKEWIEDFSLFLAHVGRRPSSKHSIDRINNDLGYHPGNVRWSLPPEQAKNRSSNINITYNGETKVLSEWAKEIGVPYNTLRNRIFTLGWAIETAMTKNIHTKGKK